MTLTKNTALENEKMQFAANMTHDLRNPIAGIKTTAEVLIKNHEHSSDEERLLQNIVNASSQLDEIISHILKMSRESDAKEVVSTFSLQALIADVIEVVVLSAEAKNLALFVDSSKDILITADRYRCFRIVLNLVENAIKYTHKGQILIRYSQQDNVIKIEIEDTGIGISKHRQADIFNCYTQLGLGSLGSEGIGLGLHLVLLFAEQMGGQITVKSKKNQGSVFVFSFSDVM